MRKPGSWSRSPRPSRSYGLVVLSVKVSVFAYAPVRSASVEAIGCLKLIATGSLETGPFYVFSAVGADEPPTGAYVVASVVALACSGDGRLNAPLTRWPVAVLDGSATVSVASPAVEMTFAVVDAK